MPLTKFNNSMKCSYPIILTLIGAHCRTAAWHWEPLQSYANNQQIKWPKESKKSIRKYRHRVLCENELCEKLCCCVVVWNRSVLLCVACWYADFITMEAERYASKPNQLQSFVSRSFLKWYPIIWSCFLLSRNSQKRKAIITTVPNLTSYCLHLAKHCDARRPIPGCYTNHWCNSLNLFFPEPEMGNTAIYE